MYLHTLDAVEAVRPGAPVYILHGVLQQGPHPAGAESWGNGFAASPALLQLGVSGTCTRHLDVCAEGALLAYGQRLATL